MLEATEAVDRDPRGDITHRFESIEPAWRGHTLTVKKSDASFAALAALLMLACDEPKAMVDDSGENSGESVDASSSGEAGVDGESGDGDAGDGTGDTTGDTTGGDTEGGGDCSLGQYVPPPFSEMPDWTNLSGLVSHEVSHAAMGLSTQHVGARFFTTDYVDTSQICIEIIVEPTGVDSCWVWYTQGEGLGGDVPDNWYDDLPIQTVTFDVGDGPIALDVTSANELNPSSYFAELPPPPAGVPFAGTATLVATFDGLPAVGLDLDVPSDILPLGHALDTATLSSEELASWTWSTPGGDAPVELEIKLGETSPGTGWSEWAVIQCEITDDGEFAFPAEYLDLVCERLGPELYASSRLTREARGSTMLAGKSLLWRSSITAWLTTEVVD